MGFTGSDEDVSELRKIDARRIAFTLQTKSRERRIRAPGFPGRRAVETGSRIELETTFIGRDGKGSSAGRVGQSGRQIKLVSAGKRIAVTMLPKEMRDDIPEAARRGEIARAAGDGLGAPERRHPFIHQKYAVGKTVRS